MKKVLLLLAVLLVLAGATAITLRRAGGVGSAFPVSRAAELVPPSTLAFLQIHDFDRLRARDQSHRGNHRGDPELASLANLFGSANPLGVLVEEAILNVQKVDAQGYFLAVTDVQDGAPTKLVAGLSWRGRKEEVEEFLRQQKTALFNTWPNAKSVLSTYRGIEVESCTPIFFSNRSLSYPPICISDESSYDPPKTSNLDIRGLHLAFRDNWLFMTTDRDLLTETLDRYLAKTGATKSLATEADFAGCRGHEIASPELSLWLRWKPLGQEAVACNYSLMSLRMAYASGEVRAIQFSAAIESERPHLRRETYFHCADSPRPADRSAAR